MSAQLQTAVAAATTLFTAQLQLEAGVTAYLQAPSMHALRNVVARLQPTESANDNGMTVAQATALVEAVKGNVPTPNGVTVPVGSSATPTAASSVQAVAATGAGDAGNADVGAQPAASSAPTVSSNAASESRAVSFDELKKAFLALSTKPAGREKCEAVLKPFGLAKLSAATPEQYAAVLAEIEKAGK